MSRKLGSPVKVEWTDAAAHFIGWSDPDELDLECMPVTTVGVFVRKDTDIFVVALNHSTDQDFFSEYMSIPTAWIKKITWLK
jgi:hypothetical protein